MSYRRHTSLIDELIAFEEWIERKEEAKEKKRKDKKPEVTPYRFTFAEGMLVALMLQWFVAPLVQVYLKTHGLQ